MRRIRRAPAIAGTLAALLLAPAAAAQEGTIEGRVTDATGLVLPGVTVAARGADGDGPARAGVTDGRSRFAVPLPPGTYAVTFALAGFETVARGGVAVAAGSAGPASPISAWSTATPAPPAAACSATTRRC